MASIQVDVDTTPLAASVDNTRGHLNLVTGAVTTMEAAVIAAENEAAQTICKNVDNGFYILVKSQISQKAVAAYTEMASKQMTLLQLVKALDNVKRQMENDFYMITKRYTKLFQSLNKSLETRVKELDRPAMRLAEIRKNMVFDKLKDDSSMLLSVSAESLPMAQTALSGKMKQKTQVAMQSLAGYVDESRSYSERVDSILTGGEKTSNSADLCYLPVVILETDSLLNLDDKIESVFTAHTDVWQNSASIVSEISRVQPELKWTASSAEEKSFIRGDFLSLCENEISEERLSKEIIRLFDESSWEKCVNEL
ncbi:MAG TPA: hypothetical protein DEQ14_05210 [Treponema sp.]|nr:hypothetical protein [Treponema sp.]